MDENMSLMKPTFLFDDRKRFVAECEHDRLRSSVQPKTETMLSNDPWKQSPIDFTMKNFHPTRKKNSNASSFSDLTLKEKPPESPPRQYNPVVMKPFSVQYQNLGTKYSKNDHLDDKDMFVLDTRVKYDHVERILNTDQYINPKLHDFRQYPNIKELGLSEFNTFYSRDPYNIRFLSDHLNTIWLQAREDERIPVVQKPLPDMYRVISARPKWDSRLILPKLAFPNKYTAYTRYRNPTRTVQSAYWERVEDHLERGQTRPSNVT